MALQEDVRHFEIYVKSKTTIKLEAYWFLLANPQENTLSSFNSDGKEATQDVEVKLLLQ